MKRLFAAALLLWAFAAHAADGISVDLGKGDRHTSLARVAMHWNYELVKFAPHDVHPYIEVSVAHWHTDKSGLYDTAITPVFRYARSPRNGPYVEGAIGLHMEVRRVLRLTPGQHLTKTSALLNDLHGLFAVQGISGFRASRKGNSGS